MHVMNYENENTMDDNTLNKYLLNLKFIVLVDFKTYQPVALFFGFGLPNLHSEILEEAKRQYSEKGIAVSIEGGGRITKKDHFIVFHGRSEKYGRYDDQTVLRLAKEHPYFENQEYIFLSKSGIDDVNRIIHSYSGPNNS